jgi:hypothetical protein
VARQILALAAFMRVLRELGKAVLLLAVLTFGIAPVSAQTGSTIPPAVISISTVDPLLAPLISGPVFTGRIDGRPLEFIAAVSRVDSSPADVYFGVIIPGGRIFSWIPGTANVPMLVEGLFPAAQRITDTAISSAGMLGSNPQHSFSADHPLGLYSVFCFFVRTGAAPGDPRQWFAAAMSPLVITN